MFKNVSFKKRLILLCVFMSTVSLIIGGVAIYGFITFSKVSDNVTRNVIPKLTLLSEMDVNYQKTRIQVRTLGLDNLSLMQRNSSINGALEVVGNYEKAATELKKFVKTEKQKELYENLEKQWLDFKAVGVRAIKLGKIYDEKSRAELLEIFLVHCPKAAHNFQTALDAYNANVQTELVNSIKLFEAVTKEVQIIELVLFVVMILGTSLGLFIGIIFANAISKTIRRSIEGLTNSSTFLTKSSGDILNSSSRLAESSQEQDSALHESSASLDEIGSMIKMTADNAVKSNELATESLDHASEGKEIVTEMNQSMDSINGNIDTIVSELDINNDKMKEIANLINSIDEKTQVINDIVFQTKLLSFNASVEAARAGESGKGFAVVAEEVGKLAEMSGGAAVEITEILASSVTQVNDMIMDSQNRFSKVVDDVRSSVMCGSETAKECERILDSIVKSVSSVSSSVSEISTATQEQSSGINQLQTGISNIDVLSKTNTGIAHESSHISTQLNDQVVTMNKSIRDIKKIILGEVAKAGPKKKSVEIDKKHNKFSLPTADNKGFIKEVA